MGPVELYGTCLDVVIASNTASRMRYGYYAGALGYFLGSPTQRWDGVVNLLITDNQMTNACKGILLCNNFTPSPRAGDPGLGPNILNCIVRDNIVSNADWFGLSQDRMSIHYHWDWPWAQNTVFERNRVTDAGKGMVFGKQQGWTIARNNTFLKAAYTGVMTGAYFDTNSVFPYLYGNTYGTGVTNRYGGRLPGSGQALARRVVSFYGVAGESPPPAQPVVLRDVGTAALTVARTNAGFPPWPAASPVPVAVSNESAAATVSVSVVTAWVPPGLYTGTVTLVGGTQYGTQTLGVAFECVPSNIVAHWKLDEGGGTNVSDVTGHGHHGTAQGAPAWAEGWRGTALRLSAAAPSPQAVRIPYAAGLQPTGQITLSAWINPAELTTRADHAIYCDGAGTQTVFFGFRQHGSNLVFSAPVGGGTELRVPVLPATYTNGQWHLVVATYDGAGMVLHGDGVLLGSRSASGPIAHTGGDSYLGAAGGTNALFDGLLDDVRLYARALGAQERATLAQRVPGPAPVRAGFNGTPEWWLLGWGLTNDIGWEETRDTDRDGMPAWQEWVAETCPTSAASRLQIVGLASARGTNTVTWMSSPGSRPYGVWSSTNLAAGWLLATGGLSRTPPTNAWSHPRPSAGYPYFYRVAVTN